MRIKIKNYLVFPEQNNHIPLKENFKIKPIKKIERLHQITDTTFQKYYM